MNGKVEKKPRRPFEILPVCGKYQAGFTSEFSVFFEFQTGGISDLVALGKPRGHKICRACHVMSGTIRSHTLKTWEACRTAEPQTLESYSSYRRTNTARCHASFCADPEPALRTTFWRTRRASTLRSSVACLTTSSWFRGRIV